MIAVYAITDRSGPPLPDPLRAVIDNDLALVCAPDGDTSAPSPELLWRHEELIESLMKDRDLLPVRYGTLLEDEHAAARALRDRRDELAHALDRVRGAVELAVRVLGTGQEARQPERTGSGADYIRAKARLAAAQESAMSAVHEPLSGLARASLQHAARGTGELLRAAYLVDRGAVNRFADRVGELQRAQPELRLLCTGPWPPYSFSA